jgi:hypothetical protein
MKILWRGGAAAIVWIGLLLQFWLMVHGKPPGEVVQAIVRFFSFFTILGNIAVATVLAASVLAADRPLGRWAARAGTRVAVGVYIAVTAGIYHTLLADLWRPTGLQLLADVLLHTVTPALFLADFLALPPGEAAKWRSAWKALVFPLIYGAWSLVHGAATGFYPYPFVDVGKRGYGAVLVTMLLMGAGFYAVTLALTGLQHLQRRLARRPQAPISA